ncbi:MAG: YitT family protein [Dysgonamonadaceae bacterium]|nr:YitT family protein [Dysgonamonadaceae bacterium]
MKEKNLPYKTSKQLKEGVRDYGFIVTGAFLQALSYVVFLAPFKIVPGGVYGISIVLHYLTQGVFDSFPDGLPMGIMAMCFNIPLLILAIRKLGLSSGPKTVVTFVLISVFTDTLSFFVGNRPLVENDQFIACFYGGVILGLGVACIFKAQSTSAGTDVLARVIAKNSNRKVSDMIITIDSFVVVCGLIAFQDWTVPLYSWFTIFVFGKTVDMLQPENPNRAVFIVTKKTKEVKDVIVNKLKMRGTYIHGKGMYEGTETEIIFTITERKDLRKLKDEIKEADPQAFISTMHASQDAPRPGV